VNFISGGEKSCWKKIPNQDIMEFLIIVCKKKEEIINFVNISRMHIHYINTFNLDLNYVIVKHVC
jgi:hypothetical protein